MIFLIANNKKGRENSGIKKFRIYSLLEESK